MEQNSKNNASDITYVSELVADSSPFAGNPACGLRRNAKEKLLWGMSL